MKTALVGMVALVAMTGCMTLRPIPNDGQLDSATRVQGTAAHQASTTSTSTPAPATLNTGPSLVLPATGGAPVMAIQLGGGLYLPVTGGAPVVGIPLTPH